MVLVYDNKEVKTHSAAVLLILLQPLKTEYTVTWVPLVSVFKMLNDRPGPLRTFTSATFSDTKRGTGNPDVLAGSAREACAMRRINKAKMGGKYRTNIVTP